MNASGIWRGFCNGRIGHFKFIDVEILPDRPTKGSVISNGKGRQTNGGNGPSSVEDLLIRIGLKEYTSVFVLNGYEDLELFKEIEVGDLDYLGIVNTEHRAKILASVQLLHEIDSTSDGDVAGSSSENDEAHKQQLSKLNNKNQTSPFGRRHFPRDSGCYEGSPLPTSQINQLPTCDDNNSLDSVVTQCSNEILKRVESARRMMQEEGSKGLARITKKGLLGGSRNTDDLCTRGATSDGDVAGSSSENDEAHKQQLSKLNNKNQTSPFGRRHFPRDSGCYEGSPLPTSQINQLPTCDDNNSLDSVVTQCSNEILKRVESARRMMQEEGSKGLARITKKGLLGGSRNTDDLCTRGGALSEKSSDSGVSSSSLSSGPLKNNL
uniref:CSON002862 protein n=1 Tax=Culicoides sonorensis TaxID=179676 RepID=A0A336MMG7_CULSO